MILPIYAKKRNPSTVWRIPIHFINTCRRVLPDTLREADLLLNLAQGLVGEVLGFLRVALYDPIQIILVLAQIRKPVLKRL